MRKCEAILEIPAVFRGSEEIEGHRQEFLFKSEVTSREKYLGGDGRWEWSNATCRPPPKTHKVIWRHCAPLHKEKPCGRVMGKKPQTELFEEFKKNNLDKPASFWNAMRWTDETKAELFGHKKGHQSRQLEMSGRLVVQNTFIQDPGAHLRLQKESYFLQKRKGGSTKYLIYFLLWCSNECMLFSFFWMHFLHHIFHKSIHLFSILAYSCTQGCRFSVNPKI